MKTKTYISHTGGTLMIPVPVANSHVPGGAVGSWLHVEDGDEFEVAVDKDGVPVNPSLRVLAAASEHGIRAKS